jgi:hypothetical protein
MILLLGLNWGGFVVALAYGLSRQKARGEAAKPPGA